MVEFLEYGEDYIWKFLVELNVRLYWKCKERFVKVCWNCKWLKGRLLIFKLNVLIKNNIGWCDGVM